MEWDPSNSFEDVLRLHQFRGEIVSLSVDIRERERVERTVLGAIAFDMIVSHKSSTFPVRNTKYPLPSYSRTPYFEPRIPLSHFGLVGPIIISGLTHCANCSSV